ncbi:hypothetical protein PRI8871_00682 [Pseudoprimorskyibacter insulae]|uniref:Uncharacterized protein n=1 Tax=Pseudoprimorskyibacter insulae TaxID=1695997 RepID=A0A2R8APX2_9RHOB|nr:hypothetical protein PRI8871_00682 [Pseudoprimorskyibacter insulae]
MTKRHPALFHSMRKLLSGLRAERRAASHPKAQAALAGTIRPPAKRRVAD